MSGLKIDTYRALSTRVCLALALAFAAFEFYTVGFGTLSALAQRATMLAFACVLAFLLNPTWNWPERDELGSGRRSLAIVLDVALIAIALFACGYLIVNEAALADRSGAETQLDLIVAAIGPLMLLEMVRRVAGGALFLVAATVLIYAYLGDVVLVVAAVLLALWLVMKFAGRTSVVLAGCAVLLSLIHPGISALLDPTIYPFSGESHSRMSAYLWLTSDGTFGSISAIMTEFIFIFILFAGLLEATGAGAILINLAFALTGRFRGGPAQSAVMASSMFGMVSGSTMANVVSTGTFTIPLMIRTGFSKAFAGAVEAVASCGGQIMPPIMGASVFIMSEIIGVPYANLMFYALIPALLYFLALSATIYFEASRINVRRVDPSEIPDGWMEIRKGGYLLIPVVILLASIVSGETPGRAGFKAVVSLIVMVDLVRSLQWAYARWGVAGLSALAFATGAALLLAFGPMQLPSSLDFAIALPFFGEFEAIRLALFGLAVALALVPGARGMPIAFLLGLSFARWAFPSELAWIGQIPYLGFVLPVLLVGLATVLLMAPVFTPHEALSGDKSARGLAGQVIRGMESGARNSLSLVGATSAIGLIVGMLVLAALGVRVSILVTEVASTSLFFAFVLVMIASLLLGMGLPTIAAYLLLVIVVAPALQDLGTSVIAAHMFIFYFGVLSSITPPVALAAFAAAGISGARAMQTGFVACRLAATAFIVPYLFVYYPELLLLEGSLFDSLYRLGVTVVGVIFVSMVMVGYGVAALKGVSRIALGIAALLLFMPDFWLNLAGFILGALLVSWQLMKRTDNELSSIS